MVQPRGIILPLTVQVTISSLRLPPPPESPLGATVGAEGQGHTYIHCQYNSWRQSQQSPVEVTTHLKGNGAMLSAPKLHLVDSSLQPSGHKSDSSTTKPPLPHLKLQISQCWGFLWWWWKKTAVKQRPWPPGGPTYTSDAALNSVSSPACCVRIICEGMLGSPLPRMLLAMTWNS